MTERPQPVLYGCWQLLPCLDRQVFGYFANLHMHRHLAYHSSAERMAPDVVIVERLERGRIWYMWSRFSPR
jgi:hypothetical protein